MDKPGLVKELTLPVWLVHAFSLKLVSAVVLDPIVPGISPRPRKLWLLTTHFAVRSSLEMVAATR